MSALAKVVLLVALAVASAPVSVGATQAPSPALTISGRVVFDGGPPPPVYTVYVAPVGSEDEDDELRIRPDDDGAFATPPLVPGLYSVFVMAPGYGNPSGESERFYRPGDVLTLTARKAAVITGTVTGDGGEPLGGVRVQPIHVRGEDGRPLDEPSLIFFKDAITDDRGVYRIYDLDPGGYLVMAGRPSGLPPNGVVLPGANRPPVFHPASGRRDAKEVTVAWGEERSGVDIKYVAPGGHAVAGTVVWPGAAESSRVRLTLHGPDGVEDSELWLDWTGPELTFALPGVADGEYEIVAEGMDEHYEDRARAARRVTVGGADIRSVRLTLAAVPPKASVGGRFTVEPLDTKRPAASAASDRSLAETALVGTPRDGAKPPRPFGTPPTREWQAVPSASGAFLRGDVSAGAYRLSADLPSEDWYVRGVSRGPKGDPSIRAIALAEGQKVTDLVVSIGRGAAGVSGKIAPLAGAEKIRPDLVVYLVPADPALAGNLWRYAEVAVRKDGSFEARNLAPGAYWLLARPAPAPDEGSPIWDSATRATLRADAEAAKQVDELAPHARAKDAIVRY